jgi:NADH-quinone oxidoreductase subunit N
MSHLALSGFETQIPELILVATAILIVFYDSFATPKNTKGLGGIALFGVVLSLIGAILHTGPTIRNAVDPTQLNHMVMTDGVSAVAKIIILVTLLIGLMLGYNSASRRKYRGEFYALILFAGFGALVLANAGHLVTMVLGLEILSLPLYTLAAFEYKRVESREAGLKYLLLGAFSSGFLALGCALYYAGSGTFIIDQMHIPAHGELIFAVGSAMILAGLMFKGGMLPFFAWSPDTYEGAPDFAVGLMAALAKTGTFVLLIRLLPSMLPGIIFSGLLPGLILIAAGTMLAGNLMALVQTNIKRLLAYSSIAHAGYMFLGLLAFQKSASVGVLFYLAVYAPVLVASFQIVSLFPGDKAGHELKDYAGLAHRAPFISVLFALMLISLAGLPPTAGFIGKAITFLGAVQGGLVPMVILAMLLSVIGVYYYFRVIAYMFIHEPDAGAAAPAPDLAGTGLIGRIGFCAVGAIVILFGIIPASLLYMATMAVEHVIGLN